MSESTYNSPGAEHHLPIHPDMMDVPRLTDQVKSAPEAVESNLSSGELGILWMMYQMKTLLHQMITRFESMTADAQAKTILADYLPKNKQLIADLQHIFEKEGAIVPQGFGSTDVLNDAPRLFDDYFYIMFHRLMSKIMLGFNAAHRAMSFRQDVCAYFENALNLSQYVYDACSVYLTKQGLLVRPPYVTMPKQVRFIQETRYMSGIQRMGNKRALNTMEVSYLYQIVEVNVLGMQLQTGFSQVAKEQEVRDYFHRGKELAKKVIHDISEVLLESDIQPPTPWAGKATDSVEPPFSDRMMMYLSNILSSSATIGNAMGMAFSMRSDIPMRLATIMKDTKDFTTIGGKLMIKFKWLEEPPQMEDRNEIIKTKQSR